MRIAPILLLTLAACREDEPEPGTGDDTGDTTPIPDFRSLSEQWRREGLGEAWALAAVDLDGDGSDEVLYGGRGFAALDAGTLAGGAPRWSVPWNHGEALRRGGDNDWAYAIYETEVDGDGVTDALVLASTNEAYTVSGADGTVIWSRALDTEWFANRAALFDGDGDGVPDFFPAGGRTAYSGATGEPLWSIDTYLPIVFPLVAELDGQPGDELLLVRELDSVVTGIAPLPEGEDGIAVYATSADGTLLWTHQPLRSPLDAAAVDLDGDGLTEVILPQQDGVEAVGAGGTIWSDTLGGLGLFVEIADLDADGLDDDTLLGVQTPESATLLQARGPDGAVLWEETLEGAPSAMRLLSPERLVVGTSDPGYTWAKATALDPTAATRTLWTADTHTPAWDFAGARIGGQDLVLMGGESTLLQAVDAGTGEAAWTWTSGGFVTHLAAADLDGDGVDELVSGDDAANLVASGADGDVWTRRLDVGVDGHVSGLAVGDVGGDGDADIVVSAVRYYAAEPGLVERYDVDGGLVFSAKRESWLGDVQAADLDADGDLELVVVEIKARGACGVAALDGDTGAELWTAEVGACLAADLDVGDADGDGVPEIAYGDTNWYGPWHVALIGADGAIRWSEDLTDRDSYWVSVVPGGVVHGGFTAEYEGHVTFRALADGAAAWEHLLENVPDPEAVDWIISGGSMSGALAPDLDGDGRVEVLTSNYASSDVRLLDGATGEPLWITPLEASDLPWDRRHEGAAIAWVPERDGLGAWIVASEGSLQRSRSTTWALDPDGTVFGSLARDGWGSAAVATSFGAAVGGGQGVHALEAKVD